jgi:hypothetical protein
MTDATSPERATNDSLSYAGASAMTAHCGRKNRRGPIRWSGSKLRDAVRIQRSGCSDDGRPVEADAVPAAPTALPPMLVLGLLRHGHTLGRRFGQGDR